MPRSQWRLISNTWEACWGDEDVRLGAEVFSTFELAFLAADARNTRYPNGYTDVHEEEIDHEHFK